jgi:outer membrane lipoprotein SlyB
MKKTITIIAALALVGCANTGANFNPIIDSNNRDKVESDLQDCRQYANQVAGAADKAIVGAIAGALIGAAFNAALGGNGYGNEAAAFGALSGGLEGAGSGARDQQSIIRNCMNGRGHRVLN